MSNSLRPHGLYSPWNSPGQNTVVGSLSLLHGIFPTQELNWGLLHCRWILYQLSYEGSPQFWYRKGFNSACTPLQHHVVCGISVPKAGIEPRPLTIRARSPNHWTPKECSKSF